MIGQSKISSFFKTQPMKRSLENEQSDEKSSPPSKAMKSTLSPEQKAAIEVNRQAALTKLGGRYASGMGQSWKKALEPEFTKEYFRNV